MITVFADGGSRGNPGPAAYGFVVKDNFKTVHSAGGAIGIATNNVAEYTAIIKALSWLSSKYKNKDIGFFVDSQLVARQLSGLYKVKNANIRELVFKVRQLESEFGQISYSHVPREQNTEADRQVNIALDEQLYK